jgi:hypothetical protein
MTLTTRCSGKSCNAINRETLYLRGKPAYCISVPNDGAGQVRLDAVLERKW